MHDLESMLSDRLQPGFAALGGGSPEVRRSTVADFQANGVLALARRLGRPGPTVAAEVLAAVDLSDLATAEVSGPGYLNLTIQPRALDQLLATLDTTPPATQPRLVTIDYGGPNVAKELHVGHLRSTIIGDSLARILRWLGHDVRIYSHIGDWGTPFGMLLERLVEIGEDAAARELSIGDLDGFYKAARQRFVADPEFAERARIRVVQLQQGDPETRRLWRLLVDESARYFEAVNQKLGVLLSTSDFVGESSYNDQLDDVVAELTAKGLVHESDGALVVYPPGFEGRDGRPFPFMVRKSDGGYGYQTTDLAAIRFRLRDLGAQRLIYVTGTPQRQHLAMVFAVARLAGWVDEGVEIIHRPFGSMLGSDGRMLKSRSGASVKLIDLLDEAVARAAELGQAETANAIGIGAVKYADLSADMIKDYTYDLDRMIALTGDTGGYLQMAQARARSILRQAGTSNAIADIARAHISVDHPAERGLALELLAVPGAIVDVAEQLEPHRLAGQVRRLAVAFTAFWESCPVLRAGGDVRASRLALCDLTARMLAHGLDLLGIEAPAQM